MKKVIATILISIAFAFCVNAQTSNSLPKENNMNRSQLADQTFEKLFGIAGNPSPTDPELMEILQKFIFGEVFHTGVLTDKQRELITVVVLAVNQCQPQLKAHAIAALNIGVTPIEIREAIYMLSPLVGFPKVLNALDTINGVFKERGIKLPLENMATVAEDERYQKGREIQAPIYGDRTKNIASGLPQNSDFIPQLLTELCFGDFYTRKGLDIKMRELVVFCGLAALGGTEYSMGSHAIGSLKVGNSKEVLVAAMIQCAPYMGFPRTLNAIKIIKDAKI